MTSRKTEAELALDRYKILAEIGTGSMGRVYRALDPVLGREVALKTIETGIAIDDLKERFVREAQIYARLQHPNLVTVFDMGEANGHAYIVMELLEGENLRRLIRGRYPAPLTAKLAAIAQACEGLAYAHRAGIVHRDIKPSNLFLTSANRLKILDFGIARMPASLLTVDGRILGTPDYMAPEQILGQSVDGRSDLFSAALVLFEWLTGKHPFQAPSIPRRIVNEDPDRLIDADPSLPQELSDLVAKALSRDPEARYQTGDEFAAALHGWIERAEACEVKKTEEPAGNSWKLEPPPDADPAEWRVSKFLELYEEFGGALEVGAAGISREVLRRMREAVDYDERFRVALADCGERLNRLDESQRTLQSRPIEPDATVEAAVQPEANHEAEANQEPEAHQEPEANQEPAANLDVTSLFAEPLREPAARKDPVAPPEDPAPPPALQVIAPKAAMPAPARHEPRFRSGALLMAFGLFLGTLIVVGLVLRAVMAPAVYAISPSVGTARVASARAAILAAPNLSGKHLMELKKGERVNVLSYPSARPPVWIEVQFAGREQPSPPGYMAASDLNAWSSIAFVEAYDPGDSASPERRRGYIARLEEYVDSAGSSLDRDRALLDLATQRAKSDGPPQTAPAPAPTQPAAETKPPEPAPAANAPYTPDLDFRRATAAWQNGEYARAKRALGRILKANPNDAEARKMLQKVQAAEQVDPGIVQ